MNSLFFQVNMVSKADRSAIKSQSPKVLWLTGLPGAGKSTIANAVEIELFKRGKHTYVLDGDTIRQGLNRDLGFSNADRTENLRRIGEVAKLMADAGLIVIVAVISPFASDRKIIREMMPPGEFVEIFVDTPLNECIRRDPKGLYKQALTGALSNFTGITSPYEPPSNPDIRLDTTLFPAPELAKQVVKIAFGRDTSAQDGSPCA